jgi:hypothetical protein
LDTLRLPLSRFRKEELRLGRFFAGLAMIKYSWDTRRNFTGSGARMRGFWEKTAFSMMICRQTDQRPLPRPDLTTCHRLMAGYFNCDPERLRVVRRSQKESRMRAFLA